MKPPVIVPGEAASTWCVNCQLPTRLYVPLHDGSPTGPLLGVLEVCPGCGANHATPSVTVTPPSRRWLRRRREGPLCAFGDCQRPGNADCTHKLRGDEGTTTYLFCKPAHRNTWLRDNGLG